jgi:hypothetical protein
MSKYLIIFLFVFGLFGVLQRQILSTPAADDKHTHQGPVGDHDGQSEDDGCDDEISEELITSDNLDDLLPPMPRIYFHDLAADLSPQSAVDTRLRPPSV